MRLLGVSGEPGSAILTSHTQADGSHLQQQAGEEQTKQEELRTVGVATAFTEGGRRSKGLVQDCGNPGNPIPRSHLQM